MLGVDVEREDASHYLAGGVKAPSLPRTIDHLWLFDRASGKVFYAKRDDRHLHALDMFSS